MWPGERRCPRVPLCVSSATTVSSVQNVRECLRAAHCALCVMVCVGLLCVHVLVCPRLSFPMCMVSLIWLVALRCVCVASEMNGVGQLGMTPILPLPLPLPLLAAPATLRLRDVHVFEPTPCVCHPSRNSHSSTHLSHPYTTTRTPLAPLAPRYTTTIYTPLAPTRCPTGCPTRCPIRYRRAVFSTRATRPR